MRFFTARLAGNSEKRTAILKANLLSHSESKLLLNAAVEDSLSTKSQSLPTSRAIPVTVILLLAIAVHGPLLLMKIPLDSYDANTHIFFRVALPAPLVQSLE